MTYAPIAGEQSIVHVSDLPYKMEDGRILQLGFYFWDEAGMEIYGPHATLEECRKALTRYELMQW